MTTNGHSPDVLGHDTSRPLKVAIVGAGIGGLSAAIALRRQGHQVELYEQSRFANEFGAAVHLTPNANGLLRRWNISAETFGANGMDELVEYNPTGGIIRSTDLTGPNKMWQHPWQMVHRVALHDKLKHVATAQDGLTTPAVLRTASKVVDVEVELGQLSLEDGTAVTADVVVGADGIFSKTRKGVHGQESRLFSSGKAAFRFLLPRKCALEDQTTAPLVEHENSLSMWFGADRRIVMYSCNRNETLNFVCIHPDTESHATPSDEWNKQGSVEQFLKVYQDFDPTLKQLISKANPAELKVWQLLDMKKLPSWTRDKVALIGDAAHPFTPHQAQGAAQAIEDAVALATVLPRGTAASDVPERLRLYEKIRYDRAHTIQEYSRQAGKDWVDGKPQTDMMAYVAYNFGHDEADNSSSIFNRWLWSKEPNLNWRTPASFGRFPGPRRDVLGRSQTHPSHGTTFSTTSVEFTSSRTYLETLFPTSSFKFKSPSTLCTASIGATTVSNVPSLGGGSYSQWGLYLHGVEYRKKDGSSIFGTYQAVLFEDLTNPIISNQDKLGTSKVYCHMDIEHEPDAYRLKVSWNNVQFLDLALDDLLQQDNEQTNLDTARREHGHNMLTYKCIPAVDGSGKADVVYACVASGAEDAESLGADVRSISRSTKASIEFEAGDWNSLPLLYRITSCLADIPIYEVGSAKVVEGIGALDVTNWRRIE